MKTFPGFPARALSTPVPNLFFSSLLPGMEDLAEVKVLLHLFWLLSRKKGYPRFVTYAELASDDVLLAGLGSAQALDRALELGIRRGTLSSILVEREGGREALYFLNTEEGRRTVERVERGEISLGALPQAEPRPPEGERPGIFALYEENIGLLTPLMVEELKEAERLYPPPWIEAAFQEAVERNKRSWRYISRILERWSTEGRDYGVAGGHPEEDPGKYLRGKYGHLVRR